MTEFTEDDLDALSRLHAGIGIFARIDLPSGERLLHNGMGRKEIGGETWEGVSNPFGGSLVEIGEIEEPEFGQAPAINVTISGGNKEFLKSMWDDRPDIEGASCDLYIYAEDAETGDELLSLRKIFPGKLTGLRFRFSGPTIRVIHAKVVSPFEGRNFPDTDAAWSPAGQRKRFPGDKGLDQITSDVVEFFRS